MPSGDSNRTWFPEMVTVLRREWQEAMSFTELVRLRDRLEALLQSIRSERGIHPPLMTCPKCGKKGHAAEPHVSVRAMILSLSRFGIASQTEVRRLEKEWAKYQRENALDIYGRQLGLDPAGRRRGAPDQCQQGSPSDVGSVPGSGNGSGGAGSPRKR